MTTIVKPNLFNPEHFFNNYIKCAPKTNLIESLVHTENEIVKYIDNLPNHKETYAYADSKWSIKQVLQHVNDTERIMAYRALRISRRDLTNLPGYDENEYAKNDCADSLTLKDIKDEFIAIRQSTHFLFSKMNEKVIDFKGQSSNFEVSPRAIGWIISGHGYHHLNILNERYA